MQLICENIGVIKFSWIIHKKSTKGLWDDRHWACSLKQVHTCSSCRAVQNEFKQREDKEIQRKTEGKWRKVWGG